MTEAEQTSSREQLEQAIAALEAQRAVLGDGVVDTALGPMREKLAALKSAALESQAPKQQRKLATILFMDIAGHTNIVRDLDPEENMELIDSALARLADPISRFGGHIARYQGDGFKAVFGLPNATEDDPANAVRAGLAILAEAGQIAAEVKSGWGIEAFIVRVGIDTGIIFAGGQTEGEDTIKGNPVNTAARLESAAQPGTVLISHSTYQHVRGLFEFKKLAPVAAKGYPKPVQVYQVMGEKRRAFRHRRRGIEGVETRMVGREYEMGVLQQAFNRAAREGEPQLVTVEGDEGIGKSRLLYEFENWIDELPEPPTVFHGRGRLESQGLPHSLLRDIIAFQFGIQDDDPVELVRQKVENGIKESLGDMPDVLMRAHFVGHLLGYDFQTSPQLQSALEDPRQIRNRALSYMIGYLNAIARQHPLVMLVDDMQWADESSLELLADIAGGLRDSPVLFVFTARPVFMESHPAWLQNLDAHQRIGLFPLDENDNRQLVGEILKHVDNIPTALMDLIVQQAEGNPFYTEEFIKNMLDDGTIYQDNGTWHIETDQLKQFRVPPTLVGLLQARVDRLTSPERSILQRASIIGRVFWDAVLKHLNKANPIGLDEEDIDEMLDSLQLKEMVYRRAISTFSEANEHIFKHAALQEVTYESVLLRVRRLYHASVAEWLIEHSDDRVGEIAGLIADHLERAGDHKGALKYLLMAGNQAAAASANREAVDYYTRILNRLPEHDDETRFDVLLSLNHIYDRTGDRTAQKQDLPVLEELAEKIPGAPDECAIRKARAAQRQSMFYEKTGQFALAANAAERTVQFASEGGAVDVEAAGLVRWTVALWRQGYYDQAQERAEQALSICQASNTRLYEAHARVQLGNVAWFHNQMEKAARHYEQALPIYQELNYHLGMAATLLNLSLIQIDANELAQAEAYVLKGLEEYKIIGDKAGAAQVNSLLGKIHQLRCEFGPAVEAYGRVIELAGELNDRNMESINRSHLGGIYLLAGDLEKAGALKTESLEMAKGMGNRRTQCFSTADLGLIQAYEGNCEQSQSLLEQAVDLANEIELEGVMATVLAIYGFISLAAGKNQMAQSCYEQAYELCQKIDSPQMTIDVQTGLCRLALLQEDLELAQSYAEKIAPVLEERLDGEDPAWFYKHLTCIEVFAAANDRRWRELLDFTYRQLLRRQEQVEALGLGKAFIEHIPWHGEIVRMWEQEHGG